MSNKKEEKKKRKKRGEKDTIEKRSRSEISAAEERLHYCGLILRDSQSASQSSVASHLRNVKHLGSNHDSSARLGIG